MVVLFWGWIGGLMLFGWVEAGGGGSSKKKCPASVKERAPYRRPGSRVDRSYRKSLVGGISSTATSQVATPSSPDYRWPFVSMFGGLFREDSFWEGAFLLTYSSNGHQEKCHDANKNRYAPKHEYFTDISHYLPPLNLKTWHTEMYNLPCKRKNPHTPQPDLLPVTHPSSFHPSTVQRSPRLSHFPTLTLRSTSPISSAPQVGKSRP